MNQDPNLLQVPATVIPAMHRVLAAERSASEAAQLARELGCEAGSAFHEALVARVRARESTELAELDPETFWAMFSDFFSSAGWGELEQESLHAGIVSLSSRRWAEALPDERTEYPACHLTTGVLAELLSRIAGTDLAVLEVECRSRGDDRCRFLAGGEAALGTVYDAMRNGRSFHEAVQRLG